MVSTDKINTEVNYLVDAQLAGVLKATLLPVKPIRRHFSLTFTGDHQRTNAGNYSPKRRAYREHG